MKTRHILPERRDCFVFEHHSSEVNYGGRMKFHQAAFPPPQQGEGGIEKLVLQAVERFSEMLQEAGPKADMVFTIPDSELADIFFDQWCETPRLKMQSFQHWVNHELAAVAEAYRGLRLNAIIQEHASGISRLNYLVLLALATLIAEIISEHFEKNIESLGRLATTARLTLGRSLVLVFKQVEESKELRRQRAEKLGNPEIDDCDRRLLNPFIWGFIDAADAGLLEESLMGPNPYQISQYLRNQLMTQLGQMVFKSKKMEAKNLKRSLAEPATLIWLWQQRKERRCLLKSVRRQSELRTKLIFENARVRLRSSLREYLRSSLDAREIISFVANERQMGELLTKPSLRRRFLKMLRGKHYPEVDAIRTSLKEGVKIVNQSRRTFWAPLRKRELLMELDKTLQRISHYITLAEDFRLLRSHYGRNTNQVLDWQGLRLWRGYDLILEKQEQGTKNRWVSKPVWSQHQTEVENGFVEGNLFICRPEGEIYPLTDQRREHVIFMFADLRNSTETTMKLTKDTASYLAPYLTAVNTGALSCHGQRIYFAGDGYAAYYMRAVNAIRAAYLIAVRFNKLKGVSREGHIRKAREIYQAASELGVNPRQPRKIREVLSGLVKKGVKPEVLEFLTQLSQSDTDVISETVLRNVLSKVALGFSMPRVDIGMALTNGELFYALVGEDHENKIPIVISPCLTQSARLSGSSDLVKNYIETHYSPPFPFNAYSWDQKLFNRGIVITRELFDQIQQEVEIKSLSSEEPNFKDEVLFFYHDMQLKKRIILREMAEPVLLKGIENPCRICEVALPGSPLDKQFGSSE